MANASHEHQEHFLSDLRGELHNLKRDDFFRAQVVISPGEPLKHLAQLKVEELNDPILRRSLLGGLAGLGQAHRQQAAVEWQVNNEVLISLALQSIRLAALLHDLGHPPFSHVVEFALNDLYVDITAQRGAGPITPREEHFSDILSRYQGKQSKIHEDIGNKLAAHVLLFSATKSLNLGEKHTAFNFIAAHLALRILAEESKFCLALHAIIDGPLDADRLDYVPRDAAMTGFSNASYQYDRLINSFRLIYEDVQDSHPLFLPSVQALAAIEEFFQRRFNLYAFVVYHHRVVKTDGLLREAVRGLAREWLASDESQDRVEDDGEAIPFCLGNFTTIRKQETCDIK